MSKPFPIAKTASGDEVLFRPALANRHGLITGATGTGKTVSLQVMAEGFAPAGPTVAMPDEIPRRRSSGVRPQRLRLERERLSVQFVFIVFFVLLVIGLAT